MREYRCVGNSMVNIQNMFRWSMNCDRRTWSGSARDEAAKLWVLADLLPAVPASTLKSIIQGEPNGDRWPDRSTIREDVGSTVVIQPSAREKIRVHFDGGNDRITITVEETPVKTPALAVAELGGEE